MGIARIQCYFGKHIRSRGRARRTMYGWHSYCRRCGVEMVKEDDGEWSVVDTPETGPDEIEPAGRDRTDGSDRLTVDEVIVSDPPKRSGLPRFLRRKR